MERPWQGRRVLIVDDSQKVLDQLTTLFKQAGCDVVGFAKNGVEALEQAAILDPDIVSLDIVMPEMDGIECYRKLRELSNQRHYVFISVLASDIRVVNCYEREIDPRLFLAKPVTLPLLEERLGIIMKQPQLGTYAKPESVELPPLPPLDPKSAKPSRIPEM